MKRYISLILALLLLCSLMPLSASAANTMKASGEIMDYIKSKEGCVLKAYKLEGETYWTIGYGHYGPDVKKNQTITQAEADAMFAQDLKEYESAVNGYNATYNLKLTQNEFDALVSFTYNCGVNWVNTSWRIAQYLRNGFRYSDGTPVPDLELADAFGCICNGGSGFLPGLAKRRIEEAKIFLYGDYDGTGSHDFVYLRLNLNGGSTSGNLVAFFAKDQPYGSLPTATKSGYYLSGWKTSDGTILKNSTIATKNLEVSAVWKSGSAAKTYAVTVNDGYGSGKYAAGAKVCISPMDKDGYRFTAWTASGITITEDDGYYYFTMPAKAVTVTAKYTAVSTGSKLTVKEGSGSGTYAPNTKVYIDPLVKPGYCFAGWESSVPVTYDRSCGGYYIIMPAAAVTVTAKYEVGCVYGVNCPSAHFKDVSASYWGHEGIDFCVQNGILSGTGKDSFSPEEVMTRAMLVTALYRQAGKPSVSGYKNPFSDVGNEYYRDAALWAYRNHIVNDDGYGFFLPDSIVSRQEFAVVLHRYANYLGFDTDNTAHGDLSRFADADDVMPDCRQSLEWAVANHIIIGVTDTVLEPTSGITRAQTATMILRFMQACVEV